MQPEDPVTQKRFYIVLNLAGHLQEGLRPDWNDTLIRATRLYGPLALVFKPKPHVRILKMDLRSADPKLSQDLSIPLSDVASLNKSPVSAFTV